MILARIIATFFGAGLSPKAPGTVGSLASLLLWAPLVLGGHPWWVRLVVVGGLFVVGTWASNRMVGALGEDPQQVVIDEVVGMGLSLLLATTWLHLVVGTLLFRLFDIWKPGPVGYADKHVKGGLGVMLDDVVAGGMALVVTMVVSWAWPAWSSFAT
jgi:phosphatidylglycerophosphatase A